MESYKSVKWFCKKKTLWAILYILASFVLLIVLSLIGQNAGKIGIRIAGIIWLGIAVVGRQMLYTKETYKYDAGLVAYLVNKLSGEEEPYDIADFMSETLDKQFGGVDSCYKAEQGIYECLSQLQMFLGKISEAVGDSNEYLGKIAELFKNRLLRVAARVCICWTVYNPSEGLEKSIADGMVIYTKSWKRIINSIISAYFKGIGIAFGAGLVVLAVFTWLFKTITVFVSPYGGIAIALNGGWILLIMFSVVAALEIKRALVDPYTVCCCYEAYMDFPADFSVMNKDYWDLAQWSPRFSEIYKQGEAEDGDRLSQQYDNKDASLDDVDLDNI